MRTALTAALAAGLVLLTPAAPALAHNELTSATPAEDSTLTKAPADLRLTFTDRLSELITVVVTDTDRQKVTTAKPAVAGPTATVRFTAPLPNGAYTVAYRVVSADGHTVQGRYGFRVNAPVPTTTTPATTAPATAPAPTATASPAASVELAADAATEDGGGVPTATLIAVPVLLLAAAGVVLVRRRIHS